MNNELAEIRARMIELGIGIVTEHYVTEFGSGTVRLARIHRGGAVGSRECGSLVVVGVRVGNDQLFEELSSAPRRIADAGIASLRSIGDCQAPATIAHSRLFGA